MAHWIKAWRCGIAEKLRIRAPGPLRKGAGKISPDEQARADGLLLHAAKLGDRAKALRAMAMGGRPKESGAIHAACGCPRAEDILRELRWAGGLDPNCLDERGDTPLICAVRAGKVESAALLIEWGASALMSGAGGKSPLHVAAKRGSVACARLLLESGADPRALCDKGEQPIHCAAKSGEWMAAKILLAFGADPWDKNNAGKSAIEIARSGGGENAAKEMIMAPGPNKSHRASALHCAAAFPSQLDALAAGAAGPDALALDGRGLSPAQLCLKVLGESHPATVRLAAMAEREEIERASGGARSDRQGKRRGAL